MPPEISTETEATVAAALQVEPDLDADIEPVTEEPRSEPKLTYRLLTGPDDVTFCERVSAALEDGYRLYGDPAATFDGEHVIVAQAVVLDIAIDNKGARR